MGTAMVPVEQTDLDRLAAEIRWHVKEGDASVVSALHHYAEAGRRLRQVRQTMRQSAGRSQVAWVAWLDAQLVIRRRLAYYLMEWAELVDRNLHRGANLPSGIGLKAAIREVKGGAGGITGYDETTDAPPFDLPRRDYRIVLADPPWRYQSWTGKSADPRRRRVVEDEYPTMPLEDIKALPVADICGRDALLLCWVTMPLLREGLEVVAAWGFEYRTAFLVWGKLSDDRIPAVGFGRYTRSNGELCLLGRRGAGVKPVEGVAISNLVLSKRGRHSEKPVAQYDIIDRLFGRDVPRVELFARRRMPGWDVWGLEAPEGVSMLDLEVAG